MKSLVLLKDELGLKVQVDGVTVGKNSVDAKNAILTELAEQKHTLSAEDWHAICMVLVRSQNWKDTQFQYEELGGYREEYIRV